MLVDVFSKGITGKVAETALGKAGITVNKNAIPFDQNPPMVASGIRVGTPAVTTRGMREPEMDMIADLIARALAAPEDDRALGIDQDRGRAAVPEVPAVSGTSGLTDQVAASFSERGALARVVDGYEPRDGQRRMAAAVADVIEHGGTLLAEAGTGTGKTLAYLIPAILSRQRVLVSTGTKNLQEQIFFKDLPALQPRARRAVHRHADEGTVELPVPAPVGDVPRRRARGTHRRADGSIETGDRGAAADHQRVGGDDGDRRSGRAAGPARRPAHLEGDLRRGRHVPRHRVPAPRRLLRDADAPARRGVRRRDRQPPPAVRRRRRAAKVDSAR